MTEKYGWYLLHRGWMDNDVFTQKIYCERAAWIWLIDAACWQAKKIRINGKPIELKRGQLSYSLRFLAKAWGWKLGRIRWFLSSLENSTAISTDNSTGQNIITLCNYDYYQNPEEFTAQPATQATTLQQHSNDTNKKERKEIKNINKDQIRENFKDSKKGKLVSGKAISHASSLARKRGYAGGDELGFELEGIFLSWITTQPKNPDAAFRAWLPTYLQNANP